MKMPHFFCYATLFLPQPLKIIKTANDWNATVCFQNDKIATDQFKNDKNATVYFFGKCLNCHPNYHK